MLYQLFFQMYSKLSSNLMYIDAFDITVTFLLVFLFTWLFMIKYRLKDAIFLILWSVYFTFLLSVTLLGRKSSVHQTFMDILKSYNYLFKIGWQSILYDMFFNICLFVPIGLLLRRFLKNKSSIKYVFIISFLLESLQIVTCKGIFEIADLINNTLGGIIGVGLIQIMYTVKYLFNKRKQIQQDSKEP